MPDEDLLTFATDRQPLVDDLYATLRRSVLLGLRRENYDALLRRFRATFREQYEAEFDETLTDSSILDQMVSDLEVSLEHVEPEEDLRGQADRIATALAVSISNGVTETHALGADEPMVKTWVTMEDTSVRPAHRSLHLESVPVGEPFTVAGVEMSRPGDMSAPVELWISCRCVLAVAPASRTAAGILADTHTGGTMDETEIPFYGVLAPEGVPTADGRRFAEGSMRWRDLPIPLLWQKYTDIGHDKSVIVGLITELWREEDSHLLKCRGYLLDTPEAAEAHGLMEAGALRGVSVDVYDATVEIQDLDGAKIDFEDMMDSMFDDDVEFLQTLTDGEIAGATLVAFPAFREAFINLGSEEGEEEFAISEKPWDGSASRFSEEEWYNSTIIHLSTDKENKSDHKLPIREPNGDLSRAGVHAAAARINQVDAPSEKIQSAKASLRGAYRQLGEDAPDAIKAASEDGETMVASAWNEVDWNDLAALAASIDPPAVPPVEWFRDPGLSEPTAIVVTDEGRIFGHLAAWGTCHIGIQDACVMAPHSKMDYSQFLTGVRSTSDGDVPVGQITMGTGHASTTLRARPAMAHYDDTGTAVADVFAGEDAHGIWVAGALRPGVSEEKVQELKAAALSGDWRMVQGNLELVAALAVNVPGFPIPRPALAASGGVQFSLVASGVVERRAFSVEDIETIVRRVMAHDAEEREARQELAAISAARARHELDAVAQMAGRA